MTETYGPRTEAWARLKVCAEKLKTQSVSSLFDADSDRFSQFSLDECGLLFDYSRQRIDADALQGLLELADQVGLDRWIERMFAGVPINTTENRAAFHVALRRPTDSPVMVEGQEVMALVEAERVKMRQLADELHAGELLGATGRAIDTVVNIGIGGSDLGIAMALQALAEHSKSGISFHCVSNIDGVALAHVLQRVDPETTLFVICSKTFTTLETLTNANAARAWLLEHGGKPAVAAQCVAVSTNLEAMDQFGIAEDRRFGFWDWVGGRYSMWSAVGLTVALAIGSRNFNQFLAGAHALDRHFESASPESSLPTILALIGVWNRNFLGLHSHAVLPYDDHLARFPAYLQQLEMESNGKSVRRNGGPVECDTCPVIWGEPGSNAQHSFFQLLHQGTEQVSADFILPAKSLVGRQKQQDLAAANCMAQVWALAAGDAALEGEGDSANKDEGPPESVSDPHRRYPGSRPTSLFLFEQLDPATLGKLVALYEHKVFVQGVIWDVNSFDQFGVELGKELASFLVDARVNPGMVSNLIEGAQSKLKKF